MLTNPNDDELIAAARHEAGEDRRIATLMREPKNRHVLEQRALVTEQLADRLAARRVNIQHDQPIIQPVDLDSLTAELRDVGTPLAVLAADTIDALSVPSVREHERRPVGDR